MQFLVQQLLIVTLSTKTRVLLLPILYLYCVSHCEARELWVRPLATSKCPSELCLTLEKCLNNATAYFTTNTTFHFLPGTHHINETLQLKVKNVTHLWLAGSTNRQDQHEAIIECNGQLNFIFVDIIGLHISDLTLSHCGLELPYHWMGIDLWKSQGVHAALCVGRVDLLLLENVHILEGNGYGLLTWDCRDSTLSRCKFESNYWRKGVDQSVCDNPFSRNDSECGAKPGGNVLFARLFSPSISQHVDINVLHSEFMHGIGTSFIPSKFSNNCAYAGGLGVFLINAPKFLCHISLHNCTLCNNTAPSGGNMFLYSDARLALNINNSSFCQGIASAIGGGGGGIYINAGVYAKADIHICHSSFLSNYGNIGGGMFLEANEVWENVKHVMQFNTTIEECRFHGNSGGYGGGMSIKALHIQFFVLLNPKSLILISKSVFQNNTGQYVPVQ